MSVDPLTNKFSWNSPYSFSENSVISFAELEGKEKLAKVGYKELNSSDPALKVTSDLSHMQIPVKLTT